MLFKWTLLIFAVIMSSLLTIGAYDLKGSLKKCNQEFLSCIDSVRSRAAEKRCGETVKACEQTAHEIARKLGLGPKPIEVPDILLSCSEKKARCLKKGKKSPQRDQGCLNAYSACESYNYQYRNRG